MFPSHYTSSQIAGRGKSPKQGQGILEARDLGRVRWREKERAKKKECGLENRFPVLKSAREKDCYDRAIGSSSIRPVSSFAHPFPLFFLSRRVRKRRETAPIQAPGRC